MINEESLKQAFSDIKEDIFALGSEIGQLRTEFEQLKTILAYLSETLNNLRIEQLDAKERFEDYKKLVQKSQVFSENLPKNAISAQSTEKARIPTHSAYPTHNPTDNYALQPLISQNIDSSIGNRGVPTDRQTDQQTDKNSHFSHFDLRGKQQKTPILQENELANPFVKPLKEHIQDATEILSGLDAIKKQIRIKFKQMTNQEMLVFSAIYQLEEQLSQSKSQEAGVEYRIIAQKLRLSESSIRDYVQKLINKGIPIEKIKLNNKKILLKISPELRQVASLSTILQLREI